MQGGVAQGIGWALNEEYVYGEDGRLQNPGFLDYRIPVCSDLPFIDTTILEIPNPNHPYGIRGVGETSIVPPLGAVGNAYRLSALFELRVARIYECMAERFSDIVPAYSLFKELHEEELEHARQRGARIYEEIAGYGLSADAGHITSPSPGGKALARCIRRTLEMGQIPTDQVDYINAHGTSTPANDAAESSAIQTVFGAHATDLSVSSTKGVTGHCLGAAGAIEAIFALLALRDQVAPPTANYTTPDPDCPLDNTPNQPRERRIRYAISNSSGFGGQNACIAFKPFS